MDSIELNWPDRGESRRESRALERYNLTITNSLGGHVNTNSYIQFMILKSAEDASCFLENFKRARGAEKRKLKVVYRPLLGRRHSAKISIPPTSALPVTLADAKTLRSLRDIIKSSWRIASSSARPLTLDIWPGNESAQFSLTPFECY